MFAIYKKELRSYFNSFIGWLFVGVTLFFLGLYYTIYNLLSGYPYYSYVVSSTVILFMISVPILTMRILSEERRSKTDQLILTAPVTVGGVVMGKFLALVTIFAIPTLISCSYPLILTRYGHIPLGHCYLSVLAFFLYGTASIAICLLVSALTESQVIAAVLGFALLFLGYLMDTITSMISSTDNLLTKILGYFDMFNPFSELLNGTLNVSSVVYFLSICVLTLFLAVQSIQKRRYTVSVKHLSTGAYSTGMIAIVVAIVAIVNIIMGELPASWTAVDMTAEKLYSLTDDSVDYVKKMEEDVTIYVLVSEDGQDTTLGQTLMRYDDLSDHITVKYVDPAVNPSFYMEYTTGDITVNSLIVESAKRYKVINYRDIYATSYDYNTSETITTGYDGEGQITSALDYVLSDTVSQMFMTEGHGELSLNSGFRDGLEKANIAYSTINLMNYEAVPAEANCLYINAPSGDFNEDDTQKVLDYLENGGNVMISLTYMGEEMPNLEKIMAHMGLSIVDGMIIEQDTEHYYQNPFYLLPEIKNSNYTVGVSGGYYLFAPYARGIQIDGEGTEGMSYITLMETTDKAFSKVDLTGSETIEQTDEDIEGPFAVGVVAKKTGATTLSTLTVIGSEDFFTDSASDMVSGANLKVFTSIVGSFGGKEESNVSIPVKSYEVAYLLIPYSEVIILGLLTAVVLPVGSLVAGFVIWFKRRKR